MSFTDPVFIPFFLIVLGLQAACRSRGQRVIALVAASLLFYAWWKFNFLFVLLFTAVLDFFVGRRLAVTESPRARKGLIAISLIGNLGVLAIFKYTNFAIATLNDAAVLFGAHGPVAQTLHISLPIGISFYTFQTLSYSIDVYRKKLPPERSPLDFLLFVTVFPQLVAGPIVRASQLLPQIKQDFYQKRDESGLFQILYGLAKKLLLADTIGLLIVDPVFASPASYDRTSLVLAAYAYAFQIFLDFSAYSDIAIGVARMLGFEFPKNFNAPYLATSIADFWRRWHISLTTWFRDYLYPALGGLKRSPIRPVIATLAVFVISGLWHGANLTFVLWGALHGILLVGEMLYKKRFPTRGPPPRFNPLKALLVFNVVTLAWILFRSPTIGGAFQYLARLGRPAADAQRLEIGIGSILALGASVLLHALVEPRVDVARDFFQKLPLPVRATAVVAIGVVAFALADIQLTNRAFIYFQF